MIHPLNAGRQFLLINSIRMPITVPDTHGFNDHLLNEQINAFHANSGWSTQSPSNPLLGPTEQIP